MKKGILILFFCIAACKEAYEPPVISTDHSYLVVEGFINNGADSTLFSLSHTFPLYDSGFVIPELGATVTVEGNDNSVYLLGEAGNGNYGAVLALNPAGQYRLHIKTNMAREYRSDFVPLKVSPPVDSVFWKPADGGIEIYANTHDPQSASKYYRWSYEETWQFHSIYFSELQYLPAQNSVVPWDNDSFYYCWKGDNSNTILLATSAKLSQDLIYKEPILLVPQDSWQISLEYSVNVKQYVLTENAYNFWLNMQMNSEDLGSLFSPQPTQNRGNIHSLSDPSELVIGYISAGTLSHKRIFIKPGDIPNWNVNSYPNFCSKISIIDDPDSLQLFLCCGYLLPVSLSASSSPFPPFRYDIAGRACVDCTLTGTNQKPSFWP